jgi:uncharacterized repeat protein (TIGR01451 family)
MFSKTATASPSIAGWSEVLYRDSNCNGILDSGETTVLTATTAITVDATLVGKGICLIQKEFIPANAPIGASNLVVITATFTSGTTTLTYTRQDVTHVTDVALDLLKKVCSVDSGGVTVPASCTTSNTAKSGQTLEYQVTYTNNGSTSIKDLVVNDATPAYTTFISATCGTTPTSLGTCTAVGPAVGSTGGIKWTFSAGTLASGASGTVIFRVIVD